MRKKIPSLHALASFAAAARHQSYTLAAQELALSQSAISRQISSLEEFLGVDLFKRTRHGVLLTDAGQQYARQIAPRLQALERDTLDAMAGHSGGAAGGAVSLGVVPTLAARWLIPRLPGFVQLHPEVVVHLEARTRPFMFGDDGLSATSNAISSAALDGAIVASTPEQIKQWAGTDSVQLMPETVRPVCAPALMGGKTKLSAAALAALPLLQQSTRPEAWRQWFSAAGLQDAAAAPTALAGPRYEQFSMSAAAAASGLGLALVPSVLVEAELARGELVVAHPLALPEARFYYWVQPQSSGSGASSGSGTARPAVQAFLSWLQTVANA